MESLETSFLRHSNLVFVYRSKFLYTSLTLHIYVLVLWGWSTSSNAESLF